MKYANPIFAIVTIISFAVMASYALASNANGIFPIGTEAVYIQNEACTVNMTPQRSEEDIINDMMECVELHRQN